MTYQILALFLDGGSQVVERETEEGAQKVISALMGLTGVTEVVILPQDGPGEQASFSAFMGLSE